MLYTHPNKRESLKINLIFYKEIIYVYTLVQERAKNMIVLMNMLYLIITCIYIYHFIFHSARIKLIYIP